AVIQGILPDTIDLGYKHGFTTGQPVVYNNGGGTGIGIQNKDGTSGKLSSEGAGYYVIGVDIQTIKLPFSPADANAGQDTNLNTNGTSGTQSIRAVNTGQSSATFGPAGVNTNNEANSIYTSQPAGFTNG